MEPGGSNGEDSQLSVRESQIAVESFLRRSREAWGAVEKNIGGSLANLIAKRPC